MGCWVLHVSQPHMWGVCPIAWQTLLFSSKGLCNGAVARQFQSSSWNCYRWDMQTDWNSPTWRDMLIKVSPGDLSSCYQVILWFLFWISYSNPLSSNPTYLCLSVGSQGLLNHNQLICQPLGAVKSPWAMPSPDHTSMPKFQAIQVWLKPMCSARVWGQNDFPLPGNIACY